MADLEKQFQKEGKLTFRKTGFSQKIGNLYEFEIESSKPGRAKVGGMFRYDKPGKRLIVESLFPESGEGLASGQGKLAIKDVKGALKKAALAFPKATYLVGERISGIRGASLGNINPMQSFDLEKIRQGLRGARRLAANVGKNSIKSFAAFDIIMRAGNIAELIGKDIQKEKEDISLGTRRAEFFEGLLGRPGALGSKQLRRFEKEQRL